MSFVIAQEAHRKSKLASSPTNGLLILLDDTEDDDQPKNYKFGADSISFASAFLQEAAPIIVSASLIINVSTTKKSTKKNPDELAWRFSTLTSKRNDGTMDNEEALEEKSIILAALDFTSKVARDWIIKKINSSLYLLLPRKYLQDRKISDESVINFAPQKPITSTEYLMGLKVNHMATVTLADIQKPIPKPHFADYFIEGIWNKTTNYSSIFVTNSEYKNKRAIPRWVVYIIGHGQINYAVTALSLAHFKEFLAFLEKKITTKLLCYDSCYAGGINSEILYKDMKEETEKTFPFAIIARALTDAPNLALGLAVYSKNGHLEVQSYFQYAEFFRKAINSDIIDYRVIAESLGANLEALGVQSAPQIKFPGLPWFSVLNDDQVVSIGSILARTRTQPLNIATFFKRKGEPAHPLGILLYASIIPFELIIDTKSSLNDKNSAQENNAPTIVSMIPGNAFHSINKISSTIQSVEALLNSFLNIDGLAPQKTFLIEEITGLFSKNMSNVFTQIHASPQTISYVNIWLTPQKNSIHFIYAGKVYEVVRKLTKFNLARATGEDVASYKKRFQYLKEHIDTPSLYENLSPIALANLKKTLEKKNAAQKRGNGVPAGKTTKVSLAKVLQNFGNSLNNVERALRRSTTKNIKKKT